MMKEVFENMWEMMGAIVEHDCNGRMLSADDPKKLIVGYVCTTCNELWEMKVSCIRGMPKVIGDHMRTAEGRVKFPKVMGRLYGLRGYLFVGDCVYD
jgi:hypothetical protein